MIEGTLQQPDSVASYQGYHSFIGDNVDRLYRNIGTGLVIDFHGQSAGK